GVLEVGELDAAGAQVDSELVDVAGHLRPAVEHVEDVRDLAAVDAIDVEPEATAPDGGGDDDVLAVLGEHAAGVQRPDETGAGGGPGADADVDAALALGDLGRPDAIDGGDDGPDGAGAALLDDGEGRVAGLAVDDVVDGAELTGAVGDGEDLALAVEVAVGHAIHLAGDLRNEVLAFTAAHAGIGDAGAVVGAQGVPD